MWGGYISTCLAANSSGLFRLHTSNCNLHSSIRHIKRLAYSLWFAALINKKMSVWIGMEHSKRGSFADNNITRVRER
jgi:hypothetical protein